MNGKGAAPLLFINRGLICLIILICAVMVLVCNFSIFFSNSEIPKSFTGSYMDILMGDKSSECEVMNKRISWLLRYQQWEQSSWTKKTV